MRRRSGPLKVAGNELGKSGRGIIIVSRPLHDDDNGRSASASVKKHLRREGID